MRHHPEQDDHDRSVRNEEALCRIDAQWVAHAEIHKKDAEALQLQLVETLRRLTELNHAHDQAREKEHDFVTRDTHLSTMREINTKLEAFDALVRRALPREMFESTQKEMVLRAEALAANVSRKPSSEQHEAVSTRVKLLEDWKNRTMGAAVILAMASGAIGAAVARALG